MKVKICGIADKANMLEILTLKPDLMGFIFYAKSPRYMREKIIPGDLEPFPASIKKTGVFVNESSEAILELAELYGLDFIQLHGDEGPGFCSELQSSGLRIIKAFRLRDGFDFNVLPGYTHACEYFLFDSETVNYGGSGKKFNWEILESYKLDHPFFISGGIGPQDIFSILDLAHPALCGIDLNSRFELSPGVKNSYEIGKFLQKLRKR